MKGHSVKHDEYKLTINSKQFDWRTAIEKIIELVGSKNYCEFKNIGLLATIKFKNTTSCYLLIHRMSNISNS